MRSKAEPWNEIGGRQTIQILRLRKKKHGCITAVFGISKSTTDQNQQQLFLVAIVLGLVRSFNGNVDVRSLLRSQLSKLDAQLP